MLNKIKNISPLTAYRMNLGMYAFHVIVGIVSFFYMKFTHDVLNREHTWAQAISWLWAPIFAPEFYFYVFMFFLVRMKIKFVKYLIHFNLIFILIFLLLGTFLGYSMQLSYFVFFWGAIAKITSMYSPWYFLIMSTIWFFYLVNLIYWVEKIEWENWSKNLKVRLGPVT